MSDPHGRTYLPQQYCHAAQRHLEGLTSEVYSGKKYLLWATYAGTNEKPANQVTVRLKEVRGLMAALQTVVVTSSGKPATMVDEGIAAYLAAGKCPF